MAVACDAPDCTGCALRLRVYPGRPARTALAAPRPFQVSASSLGFFSKLELQPPIAPELEIHVGIEANLSQSHGLSDELAELQRQVRLLHSETVSVLELLQVTVRSSDRSGLPFLPKPISNQSESASLPLLFNFISRFILHLTSFHPPSAEKFPHQYGTGGEPVTNRLALNRRS
jgi:hypothetical protein